MTTQQITTGPTGHVAWTMFDGNTMAGRVVDAGFPESVMVRRVDGGIGTIPADRLRPASPDDVLNACAFFSRIGS